MAINYNSIHSSDSCQKHVTITSAYNPGHNHLMTITSVACQEINIHFILHFVRIIFCSQKLPIKIFRSDKKRGELIESSFCVIRKIYDLNKKKTNLPNQIFYNREIIRYSVEHVDA